MKDMRTGEIIGTQIMPELADTAGETRKVAKVAQARVSAYADIQQSSA
jgi:hypothetical protein